MLFRSIGVGIGFGLQKIASNYVSGFNILFDRSVTIGDQLTIDRHAGRLIRMTARYVVIRSAEGAEIDGIHRHAPCGSRAPGSAHDRGRPQPVAGK